MDRMKNVSAEHSCVVWSVRLIMFYLSDKRYHSTSLFNVQFKTPRVHISRFHSTSINTWQIFVSNWITTCPVKVIIYTWRWTFTNGTVLHYISIERDTRPRFFYVIKKTILLSDVNNIALNIAFEWAVKSFELFSFGYYTGMNSIFTTAVILNWDFICCIHFSGIMATRKIS